MIPYGRQTIDEDDIEAVVQVLRSDWLTTGPQVEKFESTFADYVGAKHAVAMSSGTAALHAAMYALNIGAGDEVIVPAMTFAATANCVVFQGGTPVFADVKPDTLLIDSDSVEARITKKTKAINAVDYAGHPCNYDVLREIAGRHNLALVADACHSLGATYRGRRSGTLADLTVFSFHPVKNITTGEGGMVVSSDPNLTQRVRVFRNHGITTDHQQRKDNQTWFYQMVDLGYNYRITDFQCALGVSQLNKMPLWLKRRREIASLYDRALSGDQRISPLAVSSEIEHAYHLYVIRLNTKMIHKSRTEIFAELRSMGIGVNVHYIPVHLHPYYRNKFNTHDGLCPMAESAYEQIISLPIFPKLKDVNVNIVIDSLYRSIGGLSNAQ